MHKDIKKEIHQLIDKIDDDEALNILREEAAIYAGKKDVIEDLTPDQLKHLDEAIGEDEKGETILYEEFQKQVDEWKKKLSSRSDF